ncbi:putative transcription factor interactor and regulator CCHC(Zn) family [Helianthus anomalus]
MKIGFDKAKVTCFKCKQKGHFKRECTNRQADDSVNPFHEDYYKKAIYHRNNEQPSRTNQNQIEEGSSSKERKQAYVTIQDDEKEGWDKERECFVDPQGNPAVDPDKVDFKALVAAIRTVGVWCKGLEEIPKYREKVEEGIWNMIYDSLLKKKKKTVEEIVEDSQKLVNEVKQVDKKVEKAVNEKQQVCLKKIKIEKHKKPWCQKLR